MTETPPSELPIVDLGDAALWQDPAAALANAREAAPLARTARGERVVLRYSETEQLLADPRMRTVGGRLLDGIGIHDGPLADWWKLVMFNTNPPEHNRLRGLVSRAFTPKHTEALRPQVRTMAESMIAPMIGAGEVDFEAGLADPLPISVTCALLGVPESEHASVRTWTAELGKVFTTRLSDDQRGRCEDAITNLIMLLRELFALRRNAPREDVLTALASSSASTDGLSSAECEAMAINLLFAGHDTTRGLLSLGLAALFSRPQATDALRGAPERIDRVVEEMLRFEPPTLGSLRAPASDIETESFTLPANVPVHFLFPGSNRDPRVFSDPDVFDPFRDQGRPLSFGLGAHFCLGAGLARMEAQEVVGALIASTRLISVSRPPQLVPFATIRRFADGLFLRLEGR